MSAVLAALAALLLLASAVLWWLARRRRREAGLPAGRVIAADSREEPGRTLVARSIRLRGRPDLLVRRGGAIIPVEVKTGRTPARPHRGHVLQLLAYCLLIEETYGVRPPHGLLRYPAREFRVDFDVAAERTLRAAVDEIRRAKATAAERHRGHGQRGRCAACGYREQCAERLDA
jgi:CRISPR-associated exonuclease Cas4